MTSPRRRRTSTRSAWWPTSAWPVGGRSRAAARSRSRCSTSTATPPPLPPDIPGPVRALVERCLAKAPAASLAQRRVTRGRGPPGRLRPAAAVGRRRRRRLRRAPASHRPPWYDPAAARIRVAPARRCAVPAGARRATGRPAAAPVASRRRAVPRPGAAATEQRAGVIILGIVLADPGVVLAALIVVGDQAAPSGAADRHALGSAAAVDRARPPIELSCVRPGSQSDWTRARGIPAGS